MDLFISTAAHDPFRYFSWILAVAFSICVHEYAHALIALRYGDDMAARSGHLSLNPMVQMGPTSLIMLLVIGIAWGAVPVNPYRYRDRWQGAAVSFAGPAANLLLCLIFAAVTIAYAHFAPGGSGESLPVRFFTLACTANGVLFLFNMLPIPMFDGWSVFALFIPRMEDIGPHQAQQISLLAMAALWFTPLGNFVWYGGTAIAFKAILGWQALVSLWT